MPRYVKIFENSLTPAFCQELIDRFEADPAVQADPQPHYSTRSYIKLAESREWGRIVQRVTQIADPLVAAYFRLPPPFEDVGHREWMNDGWVLARYRVGDACIFHDDAQSAEAGSNGLRLATLLFFLNTVEEGGQLHFPLQDLKIQPVQGRAILFPAQLTHPHEVIATGQIRYVLQTWVVDPDLLVVAREEFE